MAACGCVVCVRSNDLDEIKSKTGFISRLSLTKKLLEPSESCKHVIMNRRKVDHILSELRLGDDGYRKVRDLMTQAMNNGLGARTNPTAVVKMFPSYVRSVPDGTEQGKFLALDLGGTNFRVLLIELKPGNEVEMQSKIFAVPQRIMVGPGKDLFDHIAICLGSFIKAHGLQSTKLPLGFTFSFPCKQEGLTSAKLVKWTKGFKCSGVEGEDVVRLLKEAVQRQKDYEIDVVALVNDTVGTLMAVAHRDPKCLIGMIIGTGSNACYMEQLDNVELWNEDLDNPKEVIINTEWGAFGDDGALDFMLTSYDREVDAGSMNKGRQLYEKMISGMYMGEVARLVLLRLTQEGLLFNGDVSDELATKGLFYTKYVSEIESDPLGSFNNVVQVLEDIGVSSYTDEDCRIVRMVCEHVSRRAAFLCAAGLAALLNKINRPDVTIAVDGSVYRFHPKVHDLLVEKISELKHPELKFSLTLSSDGSGIGAAIIAAVSQRLKQ